MGDDLHNLNDLMDEIEGLAIRTESAGSFVKVEDLRRLIEKRSAAKAIEEKEAPAPKTVEQARSQAKKFLSKQQGLPPPREPGRSIPAAEPHSSSRT